ncbi:putative ABC transport system ATP-binding protein [Rathayibacter sp. PhB152]|nr:putative ABC transport system ATP-binding protein [Rathayibacter sp. PhB152]TDX80964.1 putative ABC transport system ATP-binding protein [Rathayibacter sp. PhB151]
MTDGLVTDGKRTILRLEGIRKVVPLPDAPPLTILDGVDLEVGEGDHVSVVGRSGSGKSTLLNILGLIDEPTEGRMLLEGKPTETLSSRARARIRGGSIGFIFQQFNLLEGRTARENVMTPLLYATGTEFWRRASLAAEMLERVGLGHRVDSMPGRMSGGEQQRIAIARALVRRPRLILADEPTGALDTDTGESVMSLLDEIAQESGSALVTITHDPAIAARAERHYRLDHGRLSASTSATAAPATSSGRH